MKGDELTLPKNLPTWPGIGVFPESIRCKMVCERWYTVRNRTHQDCADWLHFWFFVWLSFQLSLLLLHWGHTQTCWTCAANKRDHFVGRWNVFGWNRKHKLEQKLTKMKKISMKIKLNLANQGQNERSKQVLHCPVWQLSHGLGKRSGK